MDCTALSFVTRVNDSVFVLFEVWNSQVIVFVYYKTIVEDLNQR